MKISAITSLQTQQYSSTGFKTNQNNKHLPKLNNENFDSHKLNFCYIPSFGKKASPSNSVNNYSAKNIKAMFPNNEIPKSILTDMIWETPNTDKDKPVKHDYKLNPQSYQIFTKLINAYDEKLDLKADSKIPGLKNKDLLMSFVKITQKKDSSKFYTTLAKENKPLLNHMIKSIVSITPEQLRAIMDYKHNSWRMGTFISSCNVPYIKGQMENDNKWAWDYVNYAQNPDAKDVFNDVNLLTNSIEDSKLQDTVTLYRGDQFTGILDLIYDEKGNILQLGSQVEKFLKNNPNATKEEINDYASKLLVGKKFTKDRFMSMSANKDLAYQWATSNLINGGENRPQGCVVFEEVVPKGNGLIFMEPYNAMKDNHDDQFEFLGQRGDNHVVKSVDFNKDQKVLYVKTALEHNIPEILYPANFPNIDKSTATKEDVIKAIDNKEYNYDWE